MIKKNNFFVNSKIYKINIKKTKKIFSTFKRDFYNGEMPILNSYTKDNEYKFLKKTLKKYNKCKNIVIIGMGGSILGAKSIYSFFRNRIKKNFFFFDNLDSNLNIKYKAIKNLNNTCFVVVSKSGNTLETITNLGVIFSKKNIK